METLMYLEEKIDLLIDEHQKLMNMVQTFLPNLETEKGVIHFLEITKNTFNNYLKKGIFVEGIHYVSQGKKRIFVPDEIVKLKQSGIKGKRQFSSKQEKIDAINKQLGIMPMYRSAQ